MNYFMNCLRNYVNFKDRTSRKEFWMFFLFYFIGSCIASVIDSLIGINIISLVYGLALLLPLLGASARRMHDIGKSGWMVLVCLIPIVGFIWFIILAIKEGEPQENKWGPCPQQ